MTAFRDTRPTIDRYRFTAEQAFGRAFIETKIAARLEARVHGPNLGAKQRENRVNVAMEMGGHFGYGPRPENAADVQQGRSSRSL
jgi:hypothetical protein